MPTSMSDQQQTTFKGLIIRPARNSDTQQLVKLIHPILEDYGCVPDPLTDDYDITDVENSFFTSGGELIVAVDKNNEIVGSCGYAPTNSEDVILHKLFVAKTCRGKGLGRYMMEYCISSAKSRSWKRMIIETDLRMTEAISLYKSFGFEINNEPFDALRAQVRFARSLTK